MSDAVFYGGVMDGKQAAPSAHTYKACVDFGNWQTYRIQKYAGLVEGPERKIEWAYAWVLDGEEPGADRVMADARTRGLTSLTDYPEDV